MKLRWRKIKAMQHRAQRLQVDRAHVFQREAAAKASSCEYFTTSIALITASLAVKARPPGPRNPLTAER
ncbi:MAG: hypothetical protein MPJ50_05440 [Pirellulales bacterium]|nr:hypothetical protein [Pirellulales bacterium]